MEGALEQHLDDTYVKKIIVLYQSCIAYLFCVLLYQSVFSYTRMKNPAIVGVLCTDAQGHNLGCKYRLSRSSTGS